MTKGFLCAGAALYVLASANLAVGQTAGQPTLTGASPSAGVSPAGPGTPSQAQTGENTTPPLDAQASGGVDQVSGDATSERAGDIVVTGFRQAYADALATKRNSAQITDSISSDGLGRFPDLNVGEAIQRLPGVQINREADARNATISLRGLPGTFARTTLNGVGFADPVLNGSTPLGAFNSDIFTSITIIKSPDASDIAGGLSGNIDLRIAPALGRKRGGFLKAGLEYDDLGKLKTPTFSGGYNYVGSRFAAFGVLTYREETFRRDSISVNTWSNKLGAIQLGNQKAAGANPVFDALAAQYPGGVYYPSQMRQFVRYNKGNLLTGAGGFEWEAAESTKIGLTGFYTRRNLDASLNHLLYVDTSQGNGNNTALTATSAVAHITSIGTPFVVNTPNGPRAYINKLSAENLQTYDSIRSEPGVQQTWAINPSVEFKSEDWRMSVVGTVSRAMVRANQIEFDIIQNPYRNLGPAGLNGITADINTGGTDLSNFNIGLNTPNASHIAAGGYTIPSAANQATQAGAPMPGQLSTVAGDRFGVTGTNGMSRNQLTAAQIDLERSVHDSFLSSVQVGARYEKNRFISSGTRNTSLGAQTQNITQGLSSPNPYIGDFFGNTAPGYTSSWRNIDINGVLNAITPVNTAPRSTANPTGLPGQFIVAPNSGVFLTPYGLTNNYWDPNYYNNNFTNQATVASAYGMVKWDGDIEGVHIRGNAGLRYEHTDQIIDATDCQNCSATSSLVNGPLNHRNVPRQYKNNYGYLLPSAMLAADLSSKLLVRMAYYKTYVRPQPRDNVPVTTVQTPEIPVAPALVPSTNPVYSVVVGANGLKPYTANSYDVSLEWYNRPGGIFALAVFRKDIKGYIGQITDTSILCPADGRFNGVDYGLGTLSIVGPNCVSSNQFVNTSGAIENARVLASGITNQQPIRVRGIEVAANQNFDFLPGVLRYFGGAANYTFTAISGRDPTGKAITLPSVSKHNVNVIGYFETKRFGVRATYNWRGDYDLAAGNSFVGDARRVKARSQLDASASINITDRISFSVDAFNITDATRAEYENDPQLPRRIDYDGRTYQATLRARF
ncbi:TonB-dependent receptor [Sphingomonas aquatilis NBRC 16722]|uniref:TonB-dependent receptor n=1 Tax=Sphingomonas aquatilis TaxID=93063 RepID=A0AAW3TRQ3_9SPHN|nr:TonB-dependent receptor [Sphingomonas aquatilis]MBB3874279.1 TonB-dependent receptor [Sphingomonas aquatilis]GEM70490.1 TonB-dependent receptor [Sphingomonas aquatilis NBRC 16722]